MSPSTGEERSAGASALCQESSGCVTLDAPKGLRDFYFDHCFGPRATQNEVYNAGVKNIVDGVMSGVNVAVLAYGQTGTGKTYTMEGIVPRALRDIYKHPDVVDVRMSFVQVYLDRLHDLLAPESSGSLLIREDPQKGFYVDGLRSYVVTSSIDDATYVFNCGLENRAVAATEMNMTSSRSHTILSVTVRTEMTSAKLMIVDLAGSERLCPTSKNFDVESRRFQETTSINVSLSALGNVIASLADARIRHIPFRDSPLTKLIQECLGGVRGGDANTILFATVGPSPQYIGESLSTLTFATRCMHVRLNPAINQIGEPDADTVPRQMLRDAYAALRKVVGQLHRVQDASRERAEARKCAWVAKEKEEERARQAADRETAAMQACDAASKPGKYGPHLATFSRADARQRVVEQWPDADAIEGANVDGGVRPIEDLDDISPDTFTQHLSALVASAEDACKCIEASAAQSARSVVGMREALIDHELDRKARAEELCSWELMLRYILSTNASGAVLISIRAIETQILMRSFVLEVQLCLAPASRPRKTRPGACDDDVGNDEQQSFPATTESSVSTVESGESRRRRIPLRAQSSILRRLPQVAPLAFRRFPDERQRR